MEGISPWRRLVGVVAGAVLLFLLLPSLVTTLIAFGESNQIVFPPTGFSMVLFRRFFAEEGWVSSTILSFRVAIWSTLIAIAFGVPAAFALTRGRFFGRRILAIFLLSPIMIPHVVIALALYVYFSRIGLTNGELRLVLAHSIATLPFVIVTAGAGLRHIDPAIERAATVMGASKLTVLRRVTIPLLAPTLVGSALFAFLISFDEVTISLFVARAGDTTLPVKMFASIQFEVSPVLAAISTMLTGLSIVMCLIVASVQRDKASGVH